LSKAYDLFYVALGVFSSVGWGYARGVEPIATESSPAGGWLWGWGWGWKLLIATCYPLVRVCQRVVRRALPWSLRDLTNEQETVCEEWVS